MSVTVVDAIVRMRPDFGNTIGSMSLIERGFALAIPLALAGSAAALIKTGMEAQTQLSIVAGLTGSTAAQMQYYTTSLEAMGTRFGMTLDESAKGLYYVVSAGFKGRDAIDVLTASMLHAAATGTPLKDVANGLTSAMNAYGASAKDATRYSDILTTAITYGKQTTGDFANNVSKAALMASAAHVPFTQLAAAEAALTEKGEPASRAFTELSFLMSKTSLGAFSVGEAVRKAGGAFNDAQYTALDLGGKLLYLRDKTGLTTDELLKVVGGTRSARGALGLLADSGAAYNRILEMMGKNSGVTADAFNIHTKTMGFAFNQVGAALSNAGYELVHMISPAAIDFLGKVADVAGHLPDLFNAVGKGVGWAQTQFDALGKLVTPLAVQVATSVAPAFSKLGDSVTMNAVPMKTFGKHTGEVSDILVRHKGILSQVGDAAQSVGGFLQHALGGAMDYLGPYIQKAAWAVQGFASDLRDKLGPAATNVFHFLQWVLPQLQSIWNAMWPAMSVVLVGVWDIIQGVVKIAWSIVSGIIKVGLDILGGNWKAAWNDLKDMVGGIFDGIIQIVTGAMKIVAGVVLAAVEGVLSLIAKIPGPIGDMARSALKSVQDLAAQLRQAGEDAGNKYAAGLASRVGAVHKAAMDLAIASIPTGGGTGGGYYGAHAAGGLTGPGWSLVGEQGPELAIFPQGTRIVPAAQTTAMLSGSGGGGGGRPVTIQVDLHINGKQFAQATAHDYLEATTQAIRVATGMRV